VGESTAQRVLTALNARAAGEKFLRWPRSDSAWDRECQQDVARDPDIEHVESAIDIQAVIQNEIESFSKTLEKGLREFEKLPKSISGEQAFDLYQTYGFPIEVTEELLVKRGASVDVDGFWRAFKKHQEKLDGLMCDQDFLNKIMLGANVRTIDVQKIPSTEADLIKVVDYSSYHANRFQSDMNYVVFPKSFSEY